MAYRIPACPDGPAWTGEPKMKKEVRRLDYGDRKKIQDMLDARERLADIA